ncbi:CAP domain-containing protein [Candidatus Nitrososphaera sp. FF02]|uniref:CAP domain-containing protein n=1 Tax=Candidatus Nitrososphaera sp. FF02 TaxID=3398226 RepID=UPI0039EA38EE
MPRGIAFTLISMFATSMFSVPILSSAADFNSLLLNDLKILTDSSAESEELRVNSKATFSLTISNNDPLTKHFVAIFDVRDSNQVSVSLSLEEGAAAKYATTFVRSSWIPDEPGAYTVRSFILSDSDLPEVLSSIITTKVRVVEGQEPEPMEEKPEEAPITVVEEPFVEPTLDMLKAYALQKINEDREDYGLEPVALSNNKAAQVHAEDVLSTRFISHWMTNGEKPYMTYSRLGGTGYVSQNVATAGDEQYFEDCTSGEYYCEPMDPLAEIEDLERSMMYDDEVCSRQWPQG